MASPSLPPGFRFRPTDEELVGYYLKRKVDGQVIELEVIPVIDLYKFDPWELPDRSFLPRKDQEWFFFCSRDKKYPNGSRTNRATRSGYWKATGKDRKVVCASVAATALRKTLVFYRGRAPAGDRTEWVMHEYRLCEEIPPGFTNFVGAFALCHITKRNEHGEKAGDAAGELRECARNAAIVPEGHGSVAGHVIGAPASTQSESRRGTRPATPIVIDQDVQIISPVDAAQSEITQYSPTHDLPSLVEGIGGSHAWNMLPDHQDPSVFEKLPFYDTMGYSSTGTPDLSISEQAAAIMMPCPNPSLEDYLDMHDHVSRNPSPIFQGIQQEEPIYNHYTTNGQISGLDPSWNNPTFSPSICRQASGDGMNADTALGQWLLDDPASARSQSHAQNHYRTSWRYIYS